MQQITIYVAARKYTWQDTPELVIDTRDLTDFYSAYDSNVVFYHILEVREIDVPDLPDKGALEAIEIEGLKTLRERVRGEAAAKVAAIEERISNLVSLEYLEGEYDDVIAPRQGS